MLSESQIKKLNEHLERAQNPVFFFDNDVDGLSSFLLLRRHINRGKGVAIKSFPELDAGYAKRIYELNSDYVFVLDKPRIGEGFLKEVLKMNIPVVWLDHHNINHDNGSIEDIYEKLEKTYENLHIFNPARKEKKDDDKNKAEAMEKSEEYEEYEPVSYLAYKTAGKKEDMWISMMGCVSDGFMPDFADEFKKSYPDLLGSAKTAFQVVYETDFGKIIRMMSFALKDRTSNVVKTLKFLVSAKSPYDLKEENKSTYHITKRYELINKKYQNLLEKAREAAGEQAGNMLFFQYGGEFSLSADIANELFYRFPNRIIVVAYLKGANANVSLRGNNNVRNITLKAIEGLENATGGGHVHACGAKILAEDLQKFRENLEREIK